MRATHKLAVGAGVALCLVLAMLLSFGPVVRAKASSAAERRGLELEIGAVRPGLGRIWLRDVVVKSKELPGFDVQLDSIEVQLSAGLSPRAVTVHGGRIAVRGSQAEVESQLRRFRAQNSGAAGGSGGSLSYSAEGIDVTWRRDSSESAQRAWGVSYTRQPEGEERIAADLVRVALRGVKLELAQGEVSLHRRGEQRVLERFKAGAVDVEVDVGATPLKKLAAPRIAIPSPREALDSRGVKADKRRFELDPERGPKLRTELGRAARLVAGLLPVSGELDLAGMRAKLRHRGQALNVGPARLRLARDSERVRLALVSGSGDQKTPLTLKLDVPLKDGSVNVDLAGGPVSLATLGVREGDMGLEGVARAELSGSAKATLSADGRSLSFTSNARARDLSLAHDWLSPSPVKDVSLGFVGRGTLSLDGSRIDIADGELEVGKLRVTGKGLIERGADFTKVNLAAQVPLASCQTLLDSTPEGLAPLLTGMRMSGTFAFDGRVVFDTRNPAAIQTRWSVDNQCRITSTPADISPRRFQQAWTRAVRGFDGKPTRIESGPGSANWVPYSAISRHMVTGVLICEDGAFFRHNGFDQEAIANSIRENLKAGRFVRGASTISMQLAKNLYLSRDKTLSRKLQEAVLTMLLEQELTKDQMMELYLNVIEFAPGVYGVGPGARHYFSTAASRLSLGQSLYMASILPNPKLQHFGAEGYVRPGWSSYLRKLMQIAFKIHRVNDEELADALEEQVVFGVAYSPRVPDEGELLASPELHDEASLSP